MLNKQPINQQYSTLRKFAKKKKRKEEEKKKKAKTKMIEPNNDGMFSETFSSGMGDEIAVEPLENMLDGKDENCKKCQ